MNFCQDEGPLELTRRTKVLVWNDELEVAEELLESSDPAPPSPKLSNRSVPLPKRTRSSSSNDFPPPVRRTSTDAPRPVPFAAKFQRVHPGTTGVTVLEHLERLDAVEASLQRLNVHTEGGEADEEEDVGEASTSKRNVPVSADVTSPFSPPGSPLTTVQEVPSSGSSVAEEDLVTMSKSMSQVENHVRHQRWESVQHVRNMDWLQHPETPTKRTVIIEVGVLLLY